MSASSKIDIVERENDAEYVDVVVRIEEKSTGRVKLMKGRDRAGNSLLRFVMEERNFDASRLPACADDLFSGRAFRGAGKTLRLEMFASPGIGSGCPRFALAVTFPLGSREVNLRLGSKKSADETILDLRIPSVGMDLVGALPLLP